MRLLFTSYVNSPEYRDPDSWLKRIETYTGILTLLAKTHEVLSIEHIAYEGNLHRDNVFYRFVNLGKKFHRKPARLHEMIKQAAPDFVFINGFNFPLQLILLKLTLPRKVKIIILHRAEKPFRGIKKWFQKMGDQCVSAYLFSSNEFSEAWKQNINTNKIHEVIQASSVFHPVDKKLARRNLGLQDNDHIFLWVGNLNRGKDPLTVVKGFAAFSRKEHNAKLYMIFQTDSLLSEVSELIKKEGVVDKILLVGRIKHHDLENWYNAGDFIISGSHYEGSGIAVAEAMSCGCVPILSNIISFRRMTGPGKCGLLFEAGNASDLLDKLMAARNIDYYDERSGTLQQFQTELSFEAIVKKINCITGYSDSCRSVPNNPGLAS